jgi:hypothetical protein
VDTAASAVASESDQLPANIPCVRLEHVAHDQVPQPQPVHAAGPMDVDLPLSETGAGVDVSSQRVEQHVADVVEDAEMASESIISEPLPVNVDDGQPEAVYRDQAPQPQSVRASGAMDIDLPPSEIGAEVAVDEHVAEVMGDVSMGASGHPAPAESDTLGDVDMVAGDTVIASGDQAAIESARAASTVIDSAQPSLQTNDSVPAMDNLLEDGESSPVSYSNLWGCYQLVLTFFVLRLLVQWVSSWSIMRWLVILPYFRTEIQK